MLQGLSERQKRFAEYFLAEPNAAKAAIRAGYSENGAAQTGYRLQRKPEMQAYLDEKLEHMREERVADAEEVLAFYTSVMRQRVHDQKAFTLRCEGVLKEDGARTITREDSVKTVDMPPTIREAMDAAAILAKVHGITGGAGESGGVKIVDDI